MIHLTPADYRSQPWKNGRGTTVEMWRLEREGALLVRLSRAAVVEDGPFSLFPGVERNLTVLTGPGFRLTGPGIDLRCAPLAPVAFPGDVAVVATETAGQASDDFNVMTARDLPRPEVQVITAAATLAEGGTLAIFALAPGTAAGQNLATYDLLLTDTAVSLSGPAIAVAFSFSAFVGIVFGFYPAKRAAALDPITALRSE